MSGTSWLAWLLAISAGVLSSRAATLIARGPEGVVQTGNRALLQILNFPALLVLMAVPFFVLPWLYAAVLSVTATVFNPANLMVKRNNLARIFLRAPWLNLLAIVGAAYFAFHIVGMLL
ncbi:hypothetical protein [Roseomonas sp. BN140053]|uniref:hypothetical protein n=1 Tax=Roseomonas sp. BN140053 TaxID=3391898 RepID=UPI0039E76A5A